MTDQVFKITEVVGTSSDSISKAIDAAIAKAAKSLRHLSWFEVTSIRGQVEGGKVQRYQAVLKIGFALEE